LSYSYVNENWGQVTGSSKTVFHEATLAQIQRSGVRNTEIQEGKEYDQGWYPSKTDPGYV